MASFMALGLTFLTILGVLRYLIKFFSIAFQSSFLNFAAFKEGSPPLAALCCRRCSARPPALFNSGPAFFSKIASSLKSLPVRKNLFVSAFRELFISLFIKAALILSKQY